MKTRAEVIEHTRAALAELQGKYGLPLGGLNREPLLNEAAGLMLPRKILMPSKTVIPCAAELQDIGRAEPVLIVPSNMPVELLPAYKALAVGGQVLSIARSVFALPSYIMNEAWNAHGAWNGQPLPILVAIRSEFKYLVRQKSCFFKFEKLRGSDIDQLSPREPEERDLRLGRYHWGSDMTDELTIVVAEY
ncbi:MAG: hypothetical protein ACRD4O_15300 [Bryobacteraceae bacterium]